MKDLWVTLEERTRAWDALRRQGVADSIWEAFVSARFRRTGDDRALDFLYPYLNHADRETREKAIAVAAGVFEGRGRRALRSVEYFTENRDPFLRDRAAIVVGATVTGCPDQLVLSEMAPYLGSPNRFVRGLAVRALARASAGMASEPVLAEILRVADSAGLTQADVQNLVATVFAGHPTEQTWSLVARDQPLEDFDLDNAWATAALICGSGEDWFMRGCNEVFERRLQAVDGPEWKLGFIRRNGVTALCRAGKGRGMEALRRMLHVRGERVAGRALFGCSPRCFVGADLDGNRDELIKMVKAGDLPSQRIAAVCLGRLTMGKEDEQAIHSLRGLCDAKSPAVQTAALTGLGMSAVSRCEDDLLNQCRSKWDDEETAPSAILALGMAFLGSGNRRVFEAIRTKATELRQAPVRSRRHSKPLAACYRATGWLYLGTGSQEPVEFLLDALSGPPRRMDKYRWTAATALVSVEVPASVQRWDHVLPDWWAADRNPRWNVPY